MYLNLFSVNTYYYDTAYDGVKLIKYYGVATFRDGFYWHKTKFWRSFYVSEDLKKFYTLKGVCLADELLNCTQEPKRFRIIHRPSFPKNQDHILEAASYQTLSSLNVLNYNQSKLSITPNKNKSYFLTECLLDVERRFSSFLNNRSKLEELGITWKRGYLLYGEPGNGKSSFILYLAEKYNLPIVVIDLSVCSNDKLKNIYEELSVDTPAIILYEDIDSVFNLRENINKSDYGKLEEKAVTFDTLLNCIDGVNQHNGLIHFITTNNIDKVDNALKNRPSRIDECVFISNPNEKERRELISFYFECTEEDLKNTKDFSIAKTKEYCISKILEDVNNKT